MILTFDNDIDGNHPDLEAWVEKKHREGCIFITTNGCFDLFHAGHASLLKFCAQTATSVVKRPKYQNCMPLLVVLVNTDRSVAGIKAGRPIQNWDDRAKVVDSIQGVRFVMPLREDSPVDMLSIIRPVVHIKDETYRSKPMPEKHVVLGVEGRIEYAPLFPCMSTTDLMRKILTDFEIIGGHVEARKD